jgi:hypothetical protein
MCMSLIVSSKRRLRSVTWKVQLLVWGTQTHHRVLNSLWASTEYLNGVNLVSYDHFFLALRIKTAWGLATSLLKFLDHAHTHTQSVELPCTSDQPVSYAATYTTQHNRRISMPLAGFEPAVPAVGWLQTYALERTATGIGSENNIAIAPRTYQ